MAQYQEFLNLCKEIYSIGLITESQYKDIINHDMYKPKKKTSYVNRITNIKLK